MQDVEKGSFKWSFEPFTSKLSNFFQMLSLIRITVDFWDGTPHILDLVCAVVQRRE